jgi:hypothetical protein
MMQHSPQRGSVDELKRTTLQLGGDVSAPVSSQLKQALQRVPGVLTASIDAANSLASVAHDPAVPAASLSAVATGFGVQSTILEQWPARSVGTPVTPTRGRFSAYRFMLFVVTPLFVLMCIEAISPALARNRFLTPILLSFVWAFVLVRAASNHTTSRRSRR